MSGEILLGKDHEVMARKIKTGSEYDLIFVNPQHRSSAPITVDYDLKLKTLLRQACHLLEPTGVIVFNYRPPYTEDMNIDIERFNYRGIKAKGFLYWYRRLFADNYLGGKTFSIDFKFETNKIVCYSKKECWNLPGTSDHVNPDINRWGGYDGSRGVFDFGHSCFDPKGIPRVIAERAIDNFAGTNILIVDNMSDTIATACEFKGRDWSQITDSDFMADLISDSCKSISGYHPLMRGVYSQQMELEESDV